MKRLCLFCVCLLVPHTAAAETIVTWHAEGELRLSEYHRLENTGFVPPVGTPYQLTMHFNPGAMSTTVGSPAGSNCFRMPVTASLSLGGYDYGMSGTGFTHAQLPGTTCTPGYHETQFLLSFRESPADSPWPIIPFGFMELWYTDSLVRDAFPAVPNSLGGGFQIRDQFSTFLLMASANPRAVTPELPTAHAPEPASMTLFGLGLAAIARKLRRGASHRP